MYFSIGKDDLRFIFLKNLFLIRSNNTLLIISTKLFMKLHNSDSKTELSPVTRSLEVIRCI